MPDGLLSALRLLPPGLRFAAEHLSDAQRRGAEEFRLRIGRPATAVIAGREHTLTPSPVTEADLLSVLEAATQSSVHAHASELSRGYVTAAGGVRVGVCGTAVMDGGVKGIRELSSLTLRIPHSVPGAGREIMDRLCSGGSVLILSPPGGGKTTFLRELVRTVSDRGVRVGLADERGEIAACFRGEPQLDVGRCTDVLTGAPKAEAAMMLLRSMNPGVIAMDEISAPEDAAAVQSIAGCGVRVFATAHAEDSEDLSRRPLYRELTALRVFERAVWITGGERRTYRVSAL